MKFNPLVAEIIRGEWLLDVSGNKSAIYTKLALDLLSGEKMNLKTNEPKSISTLHNYYGEPIFLEKGQSIPKNSFAKVEMTGEIIKRGDYCYWGADEIVSRLNAFDKNPNIIGIVLEIDSPGGAVSAAGVFESFAKKRTTPIVAMCDTCCSLGYLAAVQLSDRIFADNDFSARFGSIGVVASFMSPTKKYFEERNVEYHEIYPDESNEKNRPSREARDGDYDLIKKNILSPMAVKFQNIVKAKRPNLIEERGVLNGATFTAEESKELNLIDGIASIDEAIETLKILNQFK